MQKNASIAPYGITKVEYAKYLQNLAESNAPRREGFFKRLQRSFR